MSLERRIALVNSITNTMALYPMQHHRIPEGVLNEMEKEQRKFIWGEKGEKKKTCHKLELARCVSQRKQGVLA